MELQSFLESYTEAQKNAGAQFLILGLNMLALAIFTHFIGDSELSRGFKTGAIITGIALTAAGAGYWGFSHTLHNKQVVLLDEGVETFIKAEEERMDKVLKDYPTYQFVGAGLIVIALVIVLFVKSSFWSGISFAVMLFAVSFLIVEAFSHLSIDQYHKEILNSKNLISNEI